jgi:hypothetical protein
MLRVPTTDNAYSRLIKLIEVRYVNCKSSTVINFNLAFVVIKLKNPGIFGSDLENLYVFDPNVRVQSASRDSLQGNI